MNTTRTGKIARLPKSIRDELNQRLVDGEPAAEILAWLNHNWDVETVLFKYFNCRPINEQNLSDWRHGGHRDWLREQQALAFAGQLAERSTNLAEQSGHQRLPDHFATLLAPEFIKLAEVMLDEQPDTKQRWACLCEIQDRLSHLRRDDHRAIRASIHHQRWTRKFNAEDAAASQAADKEERRQNVVRYRILRSGWMGDEAKFYGGGDIGRDIAAMSLEEQHNLEFGMLGRHSDLYALKKDPDEHVYPWRRPLKNRTAQTNPSEGRVLQVPNMPTPETATAPTPADPSNPTDLPNPSDTSAPANPPIQQSNNPPPTHNAIPLANDNPPSDLSPNTPCRATRRSPASPETLRRPTPNFDNLKPLPETPVPSHRSLGNGEIKAN